MEKASFLLSPKDLSTGITYSLQDSVPMNFCLSSRTIFFDFIYIDTTHQYDQTVLELELAYKKIKNNGIVAGHDYHPQMFGEVVNAVQFFSDKYKLPFTLTTDDVLNTYIFLIQKP